MLGEEGDVGFEHNCYSTEVMHPRDGEGVRISSINESSIEMWSQSRRTILLPSKRTWTPAEDQRLYGVGVNTPTFRMGSFRILDLN